jgi:hypothetical protein
MKIINPYAPGDPWIKGNLHTHTNESGCGYYPLSDVAAVYNNAYMNYDFIAITDHCKLIDVSAVKSNRNFIIFSGTEFKKDSYHALAINIDSYDDELGDTSHQKLFDAVNKQGGINIICHPHIYRNDYWPLERLLKLSGYIAIEIFNNNVKMNNAGRAVATDIWDQLLSKGRKIWGIASDDFHHYSRCGGGFIMVMAEKNKEAILKAIKRGAFYSSSGVLLKNIAVHDNKTITLSAASPRVINTIFRFIGRDGRLLFEEQAREAESPVSYTVKGDEGYVRIEASREDGAPAWTQPFWIESEFCTAYAELAVFDASL